MQQKPRDSSLRRTAEEAWLKLVRLYTYNTPIPRGKYRLFLTALKMCRMDHVALPGRAKDGREFRIDLTTGMQDSLFFLGEYEKALTAIVGLLLREGDICVDVGANFGWYTTLFAQRVGPEGQVHSFEPVPTIFNDLVRNCELMGSPSNVFLNNAALGDRPGTVTLNLFDDLPNGHASISDQGRKVTTSYECPMVTFDSYFADKKLDHVDLVKADIEGAEMMFLKGADRLFDQKVQPIFMMEMALQQTSNFGYTPNDLIKYIGERGDYNFYAADEVRVRLKPIDGFPPDHIGANVYCIPRERESRELEKLVDR